MRHLQVGLMSEEDICGVIQGKETELGKGHVIPLREGEMTRKAMAIELSLLFRIRHWHHLVSQRFMVLHPFPYMCT